jgi:hypothetical protein
MDILYYMHSMYCISLLTKHVTHDINIMHDLLKGHNVELAVLSMDLSEPTGKPPDMLQIR